MAEETSEQKNNGETKERSIKSVINNTLKGLSTYCETDSRGLGTTANVQGFPDITTNYIEIPTPAWYPDSFIRSLKRNSYMKMVNSASFIGNKNSIKSANDGNSLDFYQEDSGNAIEGLVKSATKSILSTAANQIVSITSKVDSLVNSLDSFFGDKTGNESLNKAISDVAKEPFIAAQPYLTIYGIHVTESMRDNIFSLQSLIGHASSACSKAVDAAKAALSNTNDSKKSTSIIRRLYDKFNSSASKTLKNFIGYKGDEDFIGTMTKMFTDPSLRMHGLAEALLNCTVSGTYTMKCKVPCFATDRSPIMKSCGNNGFNGLGNLRESSGKFGALTRRATGLNIVWSNPIEWETSRLESFDPVALSFDIFNDTLEHALTNLFFIWSFGATSKAVTDAMFIRPPFLYNIEIPGGFRYKYCMCNFEVTPRGKMRKLSPYSSENDTNNPLSVLFRSIFKYDVNPKSIEYIPDYYTVKMTFTSLLPDLWNFMDTYLHNREMDKVELGSRICTKMAAFMNSWNTNKGTN